LYDVANHRSLSSFYLSAFANSLALLINEVYQQKEQTEVQWNPKLPALFPLVLSIGNLFLTDFTGAHTFCLLLQIDGLMSAIEGVTVHAICCQ